MMLYLSIAVCLFSLAFLRLLGVVERRFERALVLCLTILAFAFSWTRWETGTDWEKYIAFFHQLTTLSEVEAQRWWGPVYAYTALLVNKWGGDYSVLLFIIGTIQYTALFYFLTRSCAAPLVAVFILFCGNFYGIYFVREDVSIVFFLGFMYFYYRGMNVMAGLAALAAFAFHISVAVPIALVVFIVRFDWRKVVIGVLAVCVAAYIIFRNFTWTSLQKLVPTLAYFGTQYVEVKESDLSTTERAFIKLLFLLAIVVASRVWFVKTPREGVDPGWSEFCMKGALVILLFTACLLPLSQVVARFPAFTFPLFAVIFSNYDFRFRRLNVDGAAYLGFLLMFFVELGFFYSGYADKFYPVGTILTR